MKRLLFMPSMVAATTFSLLTGCTTSSEVAQGVFHARTRNVAASDIVGP